MSHSVGANYRWQRGVWAADLYGNAVVRLLHAARMGADWGFFLSVPAPDALPSRRAPPHERTSP